MLVAASKGLLAGRFRHGPIDVVETTWTEVDANDPATRAVLLAYVPSHIRIAERQDAELEAAGLELKDNRLVDVRAIAAAAAATAAAEKAKAAASAPQKERPRAEK